ncbi:MULTISPECIES: TetR/AcrR family transcriptional regulator [Pseudomonadota]|jgi:AcrR family transcriptional regulator|uniref:TetR family transcriptional regulator n=1 Tax=Stutzerimonas stutzeri NF13 TaxID=1212548 RepID=M2V3S9_STUST|nr:MULTISPECIES: TetR/AcrR family transcriptional regulator [Pseudomonadota]WOF79145.1 TetR/AcrR family transcriptional regulator [Pseudomonas sp. FeN3W]EME00457.1 TetR family transcriptional regulator [Stutzerimonas stutzeri NF13]MBC2732670.1 TetR/AcrR family transcriptional regulator [Thiobacillus sp.]MBC2741406.1 TetR/AcrR family transcriptional regulator [Thiobacillus sp.]MBK3882832.1 TetR family transcriptional regulator [Stutzerimonas stutzeri]
MTDTPPARPRGRPRNFDRDQALRQAMQVFWTHGYEGTSMLQLVEAMGIGSPSIYAAFGSKEALFREAVGFYIASEAESAWQALERIDDTRQAVRGLLFASIDAFVATDPPRGCLIVLGAAHLGSADDSVRGFLREQRRRFRARLVARLERAVAEGDLRPDSDPAALAECVLTFFAGLAIEAVDGVPESALRQSAQLFCQRLFAPRT